MRWALAWLQRCVAGGALGLLAVLPARAESPVFRVLGAAEGLPSERVYALAQDRQGYLWIATGDGLARFDGRDMRVWRHRPGAPDSLPTNVVQTLHVDADDRVWIGLEGGGIGWLDAGRERFRRLDTADGDLRGSDIWAIDSSTDGALWFGGFDTGVYRFAPDLRRHRHWPAGAAGLRSATVLELQAEDAGRLWVGGAEGLQHWDGARFAELPAADRTLGRAPVLALNRDGGRLLVGSPAGAFARGVDGEFQQLDDAGGGPAFGLLEDDHGALWIGRSRGVERRLAGRSDHWVGAPRLRYSPGTQAIFDLLRDHEGGLWLASVGGGLLRLPPQWQRFRSWLLGDAGLRTSMVRATAFDGGHGLWTAGVDGRIERIDLASGAVQAQLQAAADWPDRQLAAIWVAGDGSVWAGHRRGLLHYRPALGELRQLPAADQGDAPRPGMIDLIVGDGDGGFWLSVHGVALEHRDAQGQLLQRLQAEQGLRSADSEQLRVAADGALWVAGGGGLLRFDAARGQLQPVPGLEGERVFGFAFAGDDELWVARRAGLQHYRRAGAGWRLLAEGMALVGLEVGGLARDGEGQLWASSLRGLWRYDPVQRSERRYGLGEGLPGQEFASRPLAEAVDGRFAAVLPDGVVAIDPQRFVETAAAPRLRPQPVQLRRAGEAVALPWANGLSLRHDDRDIRFAVQAVSFADPQAWRYRLRLSPFDPAWVDTGARGERSFASLPPGDYRLQAAVAGSDGRWAEAPAIALRVAPPWWASGWGRSGQLAILLLALWGLWRVLRRRAEDRAVARLADGQRRWALAASEQKSRFLATLAHEIRTPMTGLLGMAELLAASALDAAQQARVAAIRQSGALLLRLVNDTLDLARIEAGKLELRPRPVSLRRLLPATLAMLEGNAQAKGLALRLHWDAAAPDRVRVDPERLQQILLNLLGNAIKFSDHGEVVLQAGADPASGECLLQVSDNGPGLSVEQQARLFQRFAQAEGAATEKRYGGSGLGLAISRELASAMGGRLQLHSAPGQGTRVTLQLPLPPVAAGELEPLAAVAADASVPASLAPPAAVGARRRRILLVEDDPLAATTVRDQLALIGCDCVLAAHALAALSESAAQAFDAVLLDLDLPGMDGLTLARLLHARRPELPLIVLTARNDAASAQAAHDAGCHGFLAKPASSAQLAAALHAVCQCAPSVPT